MIKKITDKVYSLAVIGGGASGLIAAISAMRLSEKQNKKIETVIYEANGRVGKKLLVTGNGRCNFSNLNIDKGNYYGEPELALSVYKLFDNKKTTDFFRSIGVCAKTDSAGRMYPMSFQASAVLDALRYEAQRLGVKFQTDTRVTRIKRSNKGFLLNDCYFADACIVATGGKAAPVHGSDGSGYLLLEALGVDTTPVYPALVPLICERFSKGLKGVRAQGTITIKCNGKTLARDTGELQFTEYGLSGIPAMQVSGVVAKALFSEKKDVFAVVDLCPDFTIDELKDILLNVAGINPDMPNEMLLAGILPKKLGAQLITDCSLNPSKPIGRIHKAVIDKIAFETKNKKYKVSSVKSFNDAQVTSGGIPAYEINYSSMELKSIRKMYVCGEIVDVHGDCGGYNLQWAWSSGYIAGENAAKELLKCSE